MQEVLSELCVSWPELLGKHTSAATWITRTLIGSNLPEQISPFEILFGRRPRIPLDILVPKIDDT